MTQEISTRAPALATDAADVLDFWFDTLTPKQWWAKDTVLDRSIAERFGPLLERAARCELHGWRGTPHGRLAEVIVLDQFPRNIHRDTPRAFTCDALALALAQEAVARGDDAALDPTERVFLYLPYMHSESAAIQTISVALYERNGLAGNLDFAQRHKAIIDRFGRYPHRNEVLGRSSTPEELAFLQEPGSRF